MAAPAPAPRRRGARLLLPACALLVGALGVGVAWLWPGAGGVGGGGIAGGGGGGGGFHAGAAPAPLVAAVAWLVGGACPQSVRQLRARLGGLLGSAFSSPSAGGGGGGSGATPGFPALRDAATGLPSFSLAELAAFDGTRGGSGGGEASPLLLGIWGDVFDVRAKGAQFYAPGAPYAVFAGRDGTRALTLGTLDAAEVARLDVDDFSEQFLRMVLEQHKFYAGKYERVGVLREGAKASFRGTLPQLTPAPEPEPAAAEAPVPAAAEEEVATIAPEAAQLDETAGPS